MSNAPYIDTDVFDPKCILNQGRVVSGIIRTGAVTYDVNYGEYARWIYVGTTGNLSYVKYDGSTETLPNLAAGVWHPIFSLKINTSGTNIAANQLRWGS